MGEKDIMPDGIPAPEVYGPEKWCKALEIWATTVGVNDPDVLAAFKLIKGRLYKSSLGRRLFYEGENLRTEQCPRHKGHWSGIFLQKPEGCTCMRFDGDEATGWVPGPESDPAKSRNTVMVGRIVNNQFIPKNPAIEPSPIKINEFRLKPPNPEKGS